MKKHVHILSAVNAANVSKSGSTYTIKDVCGAVDDIVMNSTLYPAEQLAAGVSTLEGKPAPAGHPKNASGQFISALNGEALASAWIGSYARNARHEGGRTLVDIVVNEAQAKTHPDGAKLIERLDAAIAATNSDPIHVSTGLFYDGITANGESRGKKYARIATNLRYDHLAILLNQQGAGTPEQGVGMFLNAQGAEEEVEQVEANAEPEDRRSAGLMKWISRLLGNASADVSFDQIQSMLSRDLRSTQGDMAWLQEVFDKYAVWSDGQGKLMRQDYMVSSDGSVAFAGQAQEVTRKVSYEPISTNSNEEDPVKDKILAALNAAGIAVAGLDDTQLLAAYNSYVVKPTEEKLIAANARVLTLETAANAATEAELNTLATEMAVNSSLSVDDLKKLGLDRLKQIKGESKAAPVVVGNAAEKKGSKLERYDINAL